MNPNSFVDALSNECHSQVSRSARFSCDRMLLRSRDEFLIATPTNASLGLEEPTMFDAGTLTFREFAMNEPLPLANIPSRYYRRRSSAIMRLIPE
jgi:hypothetical protein